MGRANIIGSIAAILAATTLAVAMTAPVSASGRRKGSPPPADYVVAESRFGHGTVRGALRLGRNGSEVQTPGGNWLECATSCSETLRTETVDFWENKGGGKGRVDNPAGFFGSLSRGRSF